MYVIYNREPQSKVILNRSHQLANGRGQKMFLVFSLLNKCAILLGYHAIIRCITTVLFII